MLLKGLEIYAGQGKIAKGYLVIENGKILKIGAGESHDDGEGYDFPSTYKLVPGRIDVHIHGANGSDTMDATYDAIENIARTLPKEGTTAFLATTITQTKDAIEKALENVNAYMMHPVKDAAEVVGIHLEGPFLNREKCGAQPPEQIINGDLALFDRWQTLSGGHIKQVTMAPEIENGLDLVRHLSRQGIVASIGHSNASYKEVHAAVQAGARQVTHLFNGMSGLHHREPGVVGAAFLFNELYAEMIVDGIHICPETVNIAYQQKGSERILLITDAMRAKCMKNGTYDLGGQDVTVKDGKATLANGALAGSVLKMNDACRNMLKYTDANLSDVIRMSAENPAKQLGIFDAKGSIDEGKDADLVVLDENHEIVMTICGGHVVYEK